MISGDVGERAVARATWRLVPLMAVCYFFAYLDRTNLSVAALTMNKELGLSATAYGVRVRRRGCCSSATCCWTPRAT
ncbi:hypothetical protein [Kutzneria kofuensis]|uniref:hypothetical protein n=1 Tax=Kutzneria kofuensis TaxID=103725 RepID=UPI0031EEB168